MKNDELTKLVSVLYAAGYEVSYFEEEMRQTDLSRGYKEKTGNILLKISPVQKPKS